MEENELPFTPHSGIVQVVEGPPAQPDIAITYVETSHTAVYPGRIVNITVVAENLGETYVTFNVSVYCNTSLIDNRTIFDLSLQENVTLIFSWNTSGLTPCQIFTIRAEATPILGETNLDNNVFIDGIVKIKILGDLNGDCVVDMKDVTDLIRAFGTQPAHDRWNSEADINNDGVVDMKDVTMCLRNFGKTC